MTKDTWMIGRSSGYVFGGKYQPKGYKPDHMKGYKIVLAALGFALGIWLLFYNLGVVI